ncbi:MAG TPA: TrmH family RNA methyltransferase [Candidatus Dormibacteraeota bacterium]|nr:TrmH family RNA methyltransferase [Candidatus Dormibacteraeota bacterium]
MTASADVISSPANPRVKAAVRLRDRREREETGLTLVDGGRELLRALAQSVEVDHAFVSTELVVGADASAALDALQRVGASLIEVSPAVLAKVAFGDRSDGLVAVIRTPPVALEGLASGMRPLVVVVEALEKPGNLGAIMRTADAVGASAVIAADPRTDVFNPNAIRASVGTIFSVPLAVATASQVLDWLVGHGVTAMAARVDAPQAYGEVDLGGPIAIVLGSEAGGLTSTWNDPRVRPVRIPMLGAADSLNVSVAAAILLFEARRQRSPGAAQRP